MNYLPPNFAVLEDGFLLRDDPLASPQAYNRAVPALLCPHTHFARLYVQQRYMRIRHTTPCLWVTKEKDKMKYISIMSIHLQPNKAMMLKNKKNQPIYFSASDFGCFAINGNGRWGGTILETRFSC